jgi:acyl dehydratase
LSRIHYEDFEVGQVRMCGPRLVTREDIIEFASEFDPQPMHLDEEAAQKSMLKGLSASGWHSCALQMRLIADGLVLNSSSMGSPGIEEVKWVKPVRPGDELSVRLTVLEKRESKSRPELGFVRQRGEMLNQRGELVLDSTYVGMFGKRAAEPRP